VMADRGRGPNGRRRPSRGGAFKLAKNVL